MNYPGVVQCLGCKTVLVSNYRHDCSRCPCKNETFVDGGYDYLRYGGVNLDLILPLRLSKYPKRKNNVPR